MSPRHLLWLSVLLIAASVLRPARAAVNGDLATAVGVQVATGDVGAGDELAWARRQTEGNYAAAWHARAAHRRRRHARGAWLYERGCDNSPPRCSSTRGPTPLAGTPVNSCRTSRPTARGAAIFSYIYPDVTLGDGP